MFVVFIDINLAKMWQSIDKWKDNVCIWFKLIINSQHINHYTAYYSTKENVRNAKWWNVSISKKKNTIYLKNTLTLYQLLYVRANKYLSSSRFPMTAVTKSGQLRKNPTISDPTENWTRLSDKRQSHFHWVHTSIKDQWSYPIYGPWKSNRDGFN